MKKYILTAIAVILIILGSASATGIFNPFNFQNTNIDNNSVDNQNTINDSNKSDNSSDATNNIPSDVTNGSNEANDENMREIVKDPQKVHEYLSNQGKTSDTVTVDGKEFYLIDSNVKKEPIGNVDAPWTNSHTKYS